MKIKDRIILGSITGVLASVVPQMLDMWIHKKGITDVTYGPNAANIFLTKKQTKSPA